MRGLMVLLFTLAVVDMKPVLSVSAFLLAAALLVPGAAAARTDGSTARALAMGDAVRAVGMGADGLFFNPASIPQINQYSVNIGYGYSHWTQWHQVSASFVDSTTNKWVSGGLSYTFGYADLGDDTMTHDIRSALSTKYSNDKIFIGFGLTMRVMNLRSDVTDSRWYTDMDVGAVLGIMNVFYVGVTGQNLVQNAAQERNLADVEIKNTTGFGRRTWSMAPRKMGVGIGVSYSIFNFGLDCDVDFSTFGVATPSLMGGLEVIAANVVAIRAGFNWDRVGHFGTDGKANEEMRVSLGLGYVSKIVAVDIGYAHDVWDAGGFYLQATVRVFLP